MDVALETVGTTPLDWTDLKELLGVRLDGPGREPRRHQGADAGARGLLDVVETVLEGSEEEDADVAGIGLDCRGQGPGRRKQGFEPGRLGYPAILV